MKDNVIILDKEKVDKYFWQFKMVLNEEKCYVAEEILNYQLKEVERFLKLTKLEQNN